MFLVWLGCSTVAGLLDGPPADSDGDGLTDDIEEELGLDPASEDSDGDRLWDNDEFILGTDPTLADTDGDGYDDGDELLEGKDPLDPTSVIYQGGWPYRWDKRQLPGRRGELAEVGEPFARFVLEDQFGERVHLWDFYGDDDRPVILVVCAMWERLGPGNACDLLPRLVRGGDPWSEYYAEFESVFEAIRAGGVHLVTVVGENADGFPPTSEDIEAQAAQQVDVPGPVLLDPDYRVVEYVQLGFWPSTFLLDPELTVVDTGPWGDTPGALAGAREILGAR